jgi:diguanylate cyclase (GGDEF)-like protein
MEIINHKIFATKATKPLVEFIVRVISQSKFHLLFLLLSFWSLNLSAQQLPFAHLSISDGLEDTVIFDIEQDKQGFLWISSRTGINRFDGSRFWTYNQSDGLPHNLARDLLQTTDGTLWVASERGVAWFDGKRFNALTNWPKNVSARALSQAPDGSLWVATYGAGIFKINLNKQPRIVKQYRLKNGLPSERIRSIFVDASGLVWAGMNNYIVQISDDEIRIIDWHVKNSEIRVIFQYSDGSIWAGTRFGLARFDGEAFEALDIGVDLSKQTINTIRQDNQNNIWLGTRDFGIYRLSADLKIEHLDMTDGLPDNSVNSIFQDTENNMWFGTYGGGLARLSTTNVLNWKAQNGMPNPNVYAIADDHMGCLWFGTNGNGASRLCGDDMTHFTRKDGLPHNKILSVLIDKDETPWFGTLQGISHFVDGHFQTFDQEQGLSGSVIYHMIQSSDGTIWIGTNNGLNLYDGETFTQYTQNDGLPDNRINRILESNNGDLWIASSNGLTRYADGLFTSWSTEDGLPANFINDFYEDTQGGLWIATNSGLSYFFEGKFKVWTTKEGLPHNNCTVILPGKDQDIWVGTSRGVAIFNGTDFTVITSREGLVFDLVNRGAGYRDPEGNLWFGTGEGVSRFATNYEPGNSNPPPIHLLSVHNNLKQLNINEIIEIPQRNSSFDFEYSAISFQRAPDVNYRYRLNNGNNPKWRETRLRELQINSLAAGNYTFEVSARIGTDKWNDKPATYKFIITPPFWQTTWFIFLVLSLIILAFFFKSYRSRTHAQQLENLVKERTKQLEEVNQGLEWLANHDNLTKLANRNQIQQQLSQLKSSDKELQLGIIVIDLDHFKSVNDNYGHAAGDKALQAFAGLFHNVLREDQIASRWGGEEFIVMCPKISKDRLVVLAEQILIHCRNLRIHLSDDASFQLRCSLGFAFTPQTKTQSSVPIPWEKTIQLADMALYEAKHSGRDRAVGYVWKKYKINKKEFIDVLEDISLGIKRNIIEEIKIV